jgi:transcriptional regulator with XRE-family HTH domain
MRFMSFGENLRGELDYKGMLVKELASATGIPKHTLDNYLLTNNNSMPTADKAVAIARALGVSVEYLVTGRKTLNKKMQNRLFSPEVSLIIDRVEPLSREKRKMVKDVVVELIKHLQQPEKDDPVALTLLQKVFVQLLR